MKKYDFYSKNLNKSVIALGFFDAVHVGHKKVLTTCVELAKKLNAEPVAFTFSDTLSSFGKGDKLLSTYTERLEKFSNLGIESVLKAPSDESFFAIESIDFLRKLKEDFNVVGIVCGEDFTFGAGGIGNVEYLKEFCQKYNVVLKVVEVLKIDDKKIGARDIKGLVIEGKIKEANLLLGYNYLLKGIVKKGRGDGKSYGVPTINVDYPREKVIPKPGVYITDTRVDGVTYRGITNVGEHPTFCDNTQNIETYLLDVDIDLYEKIVEIEFLEYLRGIKRFSSPQELKAQISLDAEKAREL